MHIYVIKQGIFHLLNFENIYWIKKRRRLYVHLYAVYLPKMYTYGFIMLSFQFLKQPVPLVKAEV